MSELQKARKTQENLVTMQTQLREEQDRIVRQLNETNRLTHLAEIEVARLETIHHA